MTPRLCLVLTLLTVSLTRAVFAAAAPPALIELPVDVVENLFFVTPATPSGERLHLYTDTGGGLFLVGTLVHRLGLATETSSVDGEKMEIAKLPAFRSDASIPPPLAHDGGIPVLPAEREKMMPERWDGMLGQAWFSGRVWTWDYRVIDSFGARTGACRVSRRRTASGGIQEGRARQARSGLRRITAKIDGGISTCSWTLEPRFA